MTDPFFGRDQKYLKVDQYRDSSNLVPRWVLHEEYSTADVPWFEWVALQIEWQRGARVLEIGCGPGWFWDRAHDVLPRLHLTLSDLSRGMVDEAVTRVSGMPHHLSAAGFAADAQALPLDDNAFDIAIANHMLYHVPDPRLAVTEVARVLAPSGVFVAATNGPRHLRQLMEIRTEVFGAEATSARHAEIFGPENGYGMLRASFASVQWIGYDDELVCTNPVDVVAYLASFPPAQQAGDAARRRLEDAVAARFTGDGLFRVTKETGVFVAVLDPDVA